MIEINKTYNENCLNTMARMYDNFIDLTVTSPPYDTLRSYKGYEFDFENIAKELYRVTKQNGIIVWVVGDATVNGSETGTSFKQALYFKHIGFNLHDTMIYEKCGFQYPSSITSKRYHQVFEYVFILSKGKPKTFNPICDREIKWPEGSWGKSTSRQKDGSLKEGRRTKQDSKEKGKRFNIWTYPVGKGFGTKDIIAYQHPARFPEKLAEDHIISWSNEGDLVYDPFMGSGTTAKMALLNKRNYIGSEISQEYCKIIEERLNNVYIKISQNQQFSLL
jgi:site-specific DNA-methyltransferase (adenine-specific)